MSCKDNTVVGNATSGTQPGGAQNKAAKEGGNKAAKDALYAAVKDANLPVLESMLKNGGIFDINSPVTEDGKTLLMVACEVGFVPIVALLLEHGADVCATDKSGQTPLHRTCLMGLERRDPVPFGANYTVDNPQIIERLLDNGADVDARDNFGRTPLMFAAMSMRAETVALLIKRGADVDATCRRHGGAYDHACKRAKIHLRHPFPEVAAKALATMELLLSDYVDSTHFLLAVEHCTKDKVSCLLGRVTDPEELNELVNSSDDYEGFTALMRAARADRQETVALLMDHGADVDALALESGQTALQIAAEHGSKQTVALLIKRGAAPR